MEMEMGDLYNLYNAISTFVSQNNGTVFRAVRRDHEKISFWYNGYKIVVGGGKTSFMLAGTKYGEVIPYAAEGLEIDGSCNGEYPIEDFVIVLYRLGALSSPQMLGLTALERIVSKYKASIQEDVLCGDDGEFVKERKGDNMSNSNRNMFDRMS